jgi:NTP pyrophosphatase (non-canonical NTP hydrolase)
MENIDINKYSQFVDSVLSPQSKNLEDFIQSLRNIQEQGVSPSLLDTAATGLAGEGGEFNDIVKKLFFQGKPLTDEVKTHLKKELGDVIFYWIVACQALNVDPMEIISTNHQKLSARYPDGFSEHRSNNKAKDDI